MWKVIYTSFLLQKIKKKNLYDPNYHSKLFKTLKYDANKKNSNCITALELSRKQRHPQNHLIATKKIWERNMLVEKKGKKKKKKGIFARIQKGIHEIQNTSFVYPKIQTIKVPWKRKKSLKMKRASRDHKKGEFHLQL